MCIRICPTLFLISFLFLFLPVSVCHAQEVGLADFSLKNVDGKQVSPADWPGAKGFIIIFTCNHCPFAKLYPKRLNALHDRYEPLGVPVLAISSTDTLQYAEDSYRKMVERARKEKYRFPYLFDATQDVARSFSAEKTPHAFVIWKVQDGWEIRYDGAIDDNGAEPEKVTQPFVAMAVDALLKGDEVPVAKTKSIGCQIRFR